MTRRENISYGHPLEAKLGFSRARRVGDILALTGCAPIAPDGSVHAPGDMYAQTVRSLEIIQDVLARAGAGLEDVVRTRIMVTDMERWEEAARAHGEVFGEVRPACTFLQVCRFINPEWLVEIEADAVMGVAAD
ncbi:RidA family protein [Paucidesulfovibrio longus]|uniref:RidA family protein n=1 Tax=Paucidesulfovibrio longus TaxID=889 RepID=UPI0003B53662|nr:RidA family protein [Paucidesulfovibrio longus]